MFTLFRRKNVCALAKERFSLHFIDEDYEPEVHEYRFEYTNGDKLLETAMHCPTLPSVYLRSGKLANEITVVLVESIVDKFDLFLDEPLPISIEYGKYFESDLSCRIMVVTCPPLATVAYKIKSPKC